MRRALIVCLGFCVVAGSLAFAYWWWVSSPEYSLMQVKKAVDAHDMEAFERYVDLEGVTRSAIDQFPQVLTGADKLGEIGKGVEALAKHVAGSAASGFTREQVRRYVEKRESPSMDLGNGIDLSSLGGTLPWSKFRIEGKPEVRREGKICRLDLSLAVQETGCKVHPQLLMRKQGGIWRVGEILNLRQLTEDLSEAERQWAAYYLPAAVESLARRTTTETAKATVLAYAGQAYAKADDLAKARTCLARAEVAVATSPDTYHKVMLVGVLAVCAASIGETPRADEFLEVCANTVKILPEGARNSGTWTYAICMAQAGRIPEAIELGQQLSSPQARAGTLLDVALVAAREGEEDEAVALAKEVGPTLELIPEPSVRASSFASLGLIYSLTGDDAAATKHFDLALENISLTKDPGQKGSAYACVAYALAQAGKTERVDPLFAQALDEIKLIKTPEELNWRTMQVCINLYHANRYEEAYRISASIDDANLVDMLVVQAAGAAVMEKSSVPGSDLARRVVTLLNDPANTER